MFTKFISLFFVVASLLISPAIAEESTSHLVSVLLKWPESTPQNMRVVILPKGGNCPEMLGGTEAESNALAADYGGLGWLHPGIFTSQVLVSDYFTVCTYERRDGKMHYVPASMVLDQKYVMPLEYTPVLPASNQQFSLAVAATFAVQEQAMTPGIMLQAAWHTSLPHLVLVGGLGVEFYTLPPEIVSVRPVLEFGLGGGLTTTIPKTKLTFAGALALGGGVGSFRTHCDPPEYNPDMVYTCGSQDGFPMVFTGPWFGPMANLGLLGPVPAKHGRRALVGGQFHITVPMHLLSNTWPRYQVEEGRTVTVHTTSGDLEIQYRWAEETTLVVFPVFSGGVVFMW